MVTRFISPRPHVTVFVIKYLHRIVRTYISLFFKLKCILSMAMFSVKNFLFVLDRICFLSVIEIQVILTQVSHYNRAVKL